MPHRKSPARNAKDARIAILKSRAALNATALAATQGAGQALSWDALAELEYRTVGRVVLPSDPHYNDDRQESNPAFQAYPQVIVYCACESDVLECLAVARRYRLWVAVRSGGHSTAGYSVNNGMVIDLSDISGVALDPLARRV
ncbi:MAG: FAD-binding protein, partial [Comamonadaceae bacterium]